MEFYYPESNQLEINNLIFFAARLNEIAEEWYLKAQRLLESQLGLDKMNFQKLVGYTARLSELEQSRRLDAQHYQTRFEQLINHLAAFESKRIRDIRTYNRRGLQPDYVKDGPVDVVNSQYLGPQHIDYDGLQKTSEKAFTISPEGHIQKNDLLIYTSLALMSVEQMSTSVINVPWQAIQVNILRLNSGIDAAYMALVFQSAVGQLQTQKNARGSAQAELYPTDIDRFVVPLFPHQSKPPSVIWCETGLANQQESKRLLDQAKTRVEQLIEEATR